MKKSITYDIFRSALNQKFIVEGSATGGVKLTDKYSGQIFIYACIEDAYRAKCGNFCY